MAIEHVVIIVKENHTFDNYFGTLPGADGQLVKKIMEAHRGTAAVRNNSDQGAIFTLTFAQSSGS